jgi:hypothetical protein
MSAAVADHGVGKGWRGGMAMSRAGEIAIPCNEENRIRNRPAGACVGVLIYGGVDDTA